MKSCSTSLLHTERNLLRCLLTLGLVRVSAGIQKACYTSSRRVSVRIWKRSTKSSYSLFVILLFMLDFFGIACFFISYPHLQIPNPNEIKVQTLVQYEVPRQCFQDFLTLSWFIPAHRALLHIFIKKKKIIIIKISYSNWAFSLHLLQLMVHIQCSKPVIGRD